MKWKEMGGILHNKIEFAKPSTNYGKKSSFQLLDDKAGTKENITPNSTNETIEIIIQTSEN